MCPYKWLLGLPCCLCLACLVDMSLQNLTRSCWMDCRMLRFAWLQSLPSRSCTWTLQTSLACENSRFAIVYCRSLAPEVCEVSNKNEGCKLCMGSGNSWKQRSRTEHAIHCILCMICRMIKPHNCWAKFTWRRPLFLHLPTGSVRSPHAWATVRRLWSRSCRRGACLWAGSLAYILAFTIVILWKFWVGRYSDAALTCSFVTGRPT